ncbi:MAG: SatD family protein [Bacteroidota bacterium]
MVAILSGDIINSRKVEASIWLPELKKVLNLYGKSPKEWEIYKGDSFQVKVKPDEALQVVMHIKATIKQHKNLDVRMSIGIGKMTYKGDKITESNGDAFVRSGDAFEVLRKDETMVISTPWEKFDATINLNLNTANVFISNWTPASSKIIKTIFENPSFKQKELAEFLNKKQSNISTGLKRAAFHVVESLMEYYKTEIKELCSIS